MSDFRDPESREAGLKTLADNPDVAFAQFYRAHAGDYSPPLERICSTCGGKHVGSCPLNACSSIGRGRELF